MMGPTDQKKGTAGCIKAKLSHLRVAQATRWSVYFIAIGLIAGLGSVAFHYLCQIGIHYFLDMAAGYRPPPPAGERHLLPLTATPFNRWMLLFLPAIGGIFSGWLVYTFAPEAEGHGTDAAIRAYHHKGGFIRNRVPIIKTIASAITLTTGGSGGREGPIAQIGAGFGSFLATTLKLSDRERRIMMAAGIGAGVGSIFRAPLAGALFAAEVLYRDPDFESEVIIPAGISSVVAYCVFCLLFGWGSLFDSPPFKFRNPMELGPYLVLALVLVGTGVFYIKAFYGTIHAFESIRKIPNHIKPAIGGLLTGIIGFFLPHTLAFGYGFAQMAINNELTIPFLLSLALGKVLTTSFSIGSGGSGGVFGPSIVVGGAMGGVVGQIFHAIMPTVVTQPGAFVVVGMAGFFTAVSNTPISTIIFVSEMTNSYHLLLPSLLVCSVAYTASRRWTIFNCQVQSKVDSPAHAGDFFVDILQAIPVEDLMPLVQKVTLIPQEMPFMEFKRYFSETKQHYFPVVDGDQRLVGIFSVNDIRGVLFAPEIERLVVMKDVGTSEIIVTTPEEDLNAVLKKFTTRNIDSLPVVRADDHGILLGMLNRREVIAFYNQKVEEMKSRRQARLAQ
ncbi:chloride channel protein [Desulfosarcina ovata subsp. sediminis]|uniref:Chloride channel protein n=1 Tax=Desulfosarcina ovata subsp. sediminis TaxID=885957 RepID=A0A5K7ZK35_9BACT|nr:chloride channel protein [Desulfosarcina ovata]BBO80605.1 chloride channel protein [Desulfosarcina ovata subsp. sediminis]